MGEPVLTGVRGPVPSVQDVFGLSIPDLVARYLVGVENLDRRVLELSDDELDTAFLPSAGVGRWPARVLLGHVADTELLFTTRVRRILAEPHPVLTVWDEQAPIDAGMYGSTTYAEEVPRRDRLPARPAIGGFIAVAHTLRRWTGEWLGGLEGDSWERAGMHPERGPISVRWIVSYATWHLEHHAAYLKAKVDRLRGPG